MPINFVFKNKKMDDKISWGNSENPKMKPPTLDPSHPNAIKMHIYPIYPKNVLVMRKPIIR